MITRIGLVRPVVFGVHQYDVDTQFRQLLMELAGNFEQYAYTACPVVGAENGCMPFRFIRVGIRPGTAVPMREKHDAFLCFGLVAADDIACFQQSAVVGD